LFDPASTAHISHRLHDPASPVIREILKTEIMSNINVEDIIHDIVTDDQAVDIKGIINAAIQDALGQAKMDLQDILNTTMAGDMKMEVDGMRGEMQRVIQGAQENFYGELNELEPRILSVVRESIAKEAEDSKARDSDVQGQLSAMAREIEESKLLVEQLRQQLEAERANWSQQVGLFYFTEIVFELTYHRRSSRSASSRRKKKPSW
jgi:hypothetical protein